MIKNIFSSLILLLLLVLPQKSLAFECIAAGDFGLGGHVYVMANPNEGQTSQLLLKHDLKIDPKGIQVAPWVETSLYTTGVSTTGPNGEKLKRGVLKIYVDGRWYPFGRIKPGGLTVAQNVEASTTGSDTNDCSRDTDLPKCEFVPCNPTYDDRANDSICLSGEGETLDMGGPERTKVPCCVDEGYGLYGLIAIERNNQLNIPNNSQDPEKSRKPPSSNFRTFHVKTTKVDDGGRYFELDLTKQCYVDGDGNSVCLLDQNSNRDDIVQRGRLYFKIVDNYYNDNIGYYSVNVASGVFQKMGFIETTINTFETETKRISQGMFELISRDTNFIAIVQSLLVLYAVLFGLMFSIGMVQINQSDLVVRLLKLGIIATLISENSFEFFNTYLFTLFSELGREISHIIYESTLFYSDSNISPKFVLPENSSPLSVYDVLVNMLVSRALHMKILGLLFTQYIWYIPFIYVAIVFMFMGLLRSVVTYVTSIVLVALLLITGPIFLTMFLFKITQEFFDHWMKLLMAGAMMMMVVAAALAITITLFMNQVENLFGYSVCYQFIYRFLTDTIEIAGFKPFSWFSIYWWYPNDFFQLSNHMEIKNFFAFLFLGVLFSKIMENIPQLIDTLANNNLRPFSSFSQGVQGAFMSSPIMSAAGYARAMPMYLMKDNYISQKIAANTKVGRAVTSALTMNQRNQQILSGIKKAGSKVMDLPDSINKGYRASGRSQEGSWGQTLKASTLGAAGKAAQSYKSASESAWYRVDK